MPGNDGIQPIGKQDRNMGGMDFLILWAGAAVSLAEIWAGGLLIPLGFATGFLVILLGKDEKQQPSGFKVFFLGIVLFLLFCV